VPVVNDYPRDRAPATVISAALTGGFYRNATRSPSPRPVAGPLDKCLLLFRASVRCGSQAWLPVSAGDPLASNARDVGGIRSLLERGLFRSISLAQVAHLVRSANVFFNASCFSRKAEVPWKRENDRSSSARWSRHLVVVSDVESRIHPV